MSTATVLAPARRRGRAQGVPLRRWLRTTPGRLRSWSVGLVIGVVVVGVVVSAAVNTRAKATRAVGSSRSPELLAAEGLYGSLADADATASIIFLKAGREAPDLRQRYEADIRQAGTGLAQVAEDAGSSPSEQAAIHTISSELPVYAGDVESARANVSLGFPVGAAYLNAASALMRSDLLPAAITVYEQAAERLYRSYRSGTATSAMVLVLAGGTGALLLLLAVQLFVARRSRRVLNVGLVAATLAMGALFGWTVAQLTSAQSSLVDAQRKGSDTVQLLSAARILTLRAQADENNALIQRGSGFASVADFDATMNAIAGRDGNGGLLGDAWAVAARAGAPRQVSAITAITTEVTALRADHAEVRGDDDEGSYTQAVALATGKEAALVTTIETDMANEISRATSVLTTDADHARQGFVALAIGVPLLAVVAGLLAVAGIERRVADYR